MIEQIKKGLFKRINNQTVKGRVNKFKRKNINIFKKFETSIAAYHKGGGFKYNWDLQLFKLICLYEFIKAHDVKKILELGTGSTTSAINEYLKEKTRASALCLDESEFWIKNTTKLLQENGPLSNNLKLFHCERIINDTIPISTRYNFDYEAKNDFDLIVVDGPSTIVGNHYEAQIYNSDVIEILKYNKPQFILIDNRKSTYEKILNLNLSLYNSYDTFIWENDSKIFLPDSINFYSILSQKNQANTSVR